MSQPPSINQPSFFDWILECFRVKLPLREPLSMVVGSTLTITDRGSFFTPFGCEREIKNTLIEQHFKVFSENLWIIQD